jgi:predicted lipoprotein with Yx(FWY)xxD motif
MRRTLVAGALVAGLMGGTALAQQIILVPQPGGQGAQQGQAAEQGGEQRFMLVPAPRFQPGPQDRARGADSGVAMELYRRGYQQGISDAERAGAARQAIDPTAIERIGRELFERGYLLGMMQAQIQAAGQQQAGQQQAGQRRTGQPQTGRQQQGLQQQGQQQAGEGQAGHAQAGSPNLPQPGTGQAEPQGIEEQTYERPTGQTAGQAAGQMTGLTQADQQAAAMQGGQQTAGQQGGQQGGQQLVQTQAGTPQADTPEATIRAEESQEYGQYLVDGNGRAVYMFTADTPGEGYSADASSSCYDDCAQAWPPVLTRSTPVNAAMPVESEMIGTAERQDGTMQVTYGGWPLYYYVDDVGQDAPTGQDVESFGGEWYLVKPDGERVGHE